MYVRPLSSAEHTLHRKRIWQAKHGTLFDISISNPNDYSLMLDKLIDAEKELVAPNLLQDDYILGTARFDDEIKTHIGHSGVLLSSEHATQSWYEAPWHQSGHRRPKTFESGTAAIGALAGYETDSSFITLAGRQTGNANADDHHPYKRHIEELVQTDDFHLFISLHGMRSGLVSSLSDDRGYDLLIGVGEEPTAETLLAAQTVERVARGLGLRAAINQPFLEIRSDSEQSYQIMNEDGSPATWIFMAPEYTTRATAERAAQARGLAFAAIQIEIASGLRIVPQEMVKEEVIPMGPYLGYTAIKRFISEWVEKPGHDHVV